MKIIITGGTGSFGAAITRYLYNKGHSVIASGRAKTAPQKLLNYAEYLQIDIEKPFELPKADAIIHGAALADDKASMAALHSPNIIGTENTLQASQHIPTFIFISSSSVYLPQDQPLVEGKAGKQDNNMLSAYGLSKLKSEEVIQSKYKGDNCFILRPRAFYGSGDVQILPRMMKLVKKGVFQKPGKLNIRLSMTHYENMGQAIELCLAQTKVGIKTYNVADNKDYIMLQVLRQLFKAIYKKHMPEKEININILKVLAFFKIGGFSKLIVRALTQNMVLDTSLIEKELGYNGAITLKDRLPELENWIEKIGGYKVLQTADKKLVWQV